MSPEEQLRARLRKVEALFAGAATPGERLAAGAAIERIKARLQEARRRAASVELQVSIGDPWSRQLFLALARRYGLRPFRYPRQRRTTVMLQVPEGFFREVLWPEYEAQNEALIAYLAAVTARVIREEVYRETGEAEERAEAPRPA
jgi:hypothetical protein